MSESNQMDPGDSLRFMNHVADTLSAGAILGSMGHVLPPLAAFVGIVWYSIQIWESKTFTAWRVKHKFKRHIGKPGDRLF
jgi:hypothetical protein